ncbi:MAG: hypothetical protein PHU46_02730 [Rhodocyclaceae bacterium]|nr:hypothetical protein [Rhodocyclaceae bacterium]
MHGTLGYFMVLMAGALAASAQAADWSDTALGYRYGASFAEPFIPDEVTKHIVSLTHVGGDRYGSHFLNVDLLLSDGKDPDRVGSGTGAREIYLVYRYTLDLGKLADREFRFGPVRGLGLSAGLDLNSKADAGYNSRKRMLVAGPTLMLDVPGFLNLSLLALWESNAPYNGYTQSATPRYRYRTHPALDLAWAIPFGSGFSFEGYGDFIAAKGRNEFGGETAAETHLDMKLLYDLGSAVGARKHSLKAGIGYEWWKNKFGNDAAGPAGPGAFARTPMVRAEYHF